MMYTQYPHVDSVTFSMYRVYGWMSAALAITASIAYYIGQSAALFKSIFSNPTYVGAIIFLQLGLVLAISFLLNRMSFMTAAILFTVYACSVGITMSAIFFMYQETSIYVTFFVTAAMFCAMALYGYFTEADLTSIGSVGFMVLIGMILTGLVNLYFQSASVSYLLSAVGVVLFSLLAAYDAQRIKLLARQFVYDHETANKIALFGALALYLDFINLFLSLLRFMGARRND